MVGMQCQIDFPRRHAGGGKPQGLKPQSSRNVLARLKPCPSQIVNSLGDLAFSLGRPRDFPLRPLRIAFALFAVWSLSKKP
jgi:hypothetical protein